MLALALGLALFQDTFVVDDDGGAGVDFTDLPPAVAAAADGDLLLVRAGTYGHFDLAGKGLRILGEGTGTLVANAGPSGKETTLSDIPAGSFACLERLQLSGSGFESGRLVVAGATTRAVLSELVVSGPTDDSSGHCALRVDAARVVLLGSSVSGGPGFAPFPSSGGPGGVGLLLENGAQLFAAGSIFTGGNGAAGYSYAGSGREAVRATSRAQLWLGASRATGGSGAFAVSGHVGLGGIGLVASGFAQVRVSGDASDGVRGGQGWCPSAPGIAASAARVVVHSVPVLTGFFAYGGCYAVPQTGGFDGAGALPVLAVSGTLTAAGSVTLELTNGPAGAPFAVRAQPAADLPWRSSRAAGAPDRPFVGELLIAPRGSLLLVAGFLSPAGAASVTLPAAALGVPPYEPLLLQGGATTPAGRTLLSNPALVTLRP